MKKVNDHRDFLSSDQRTSPLLRWLDNVIHYQKLKVQRITPLQKRLAETEANVAEADAKLSTLNNKRESFDKRLADLAMGFEEATVDKQEQEKKVLEMQGRLEDAKGLRQLLQAEMERCKQIVSSCKKRLETTMFGRCAIAAATVAYLGPFQPSFRQEMLLRCWPICVQKRGLPLIFEKIDKIRGCVIEASIGIDGTGDEDEEQAYFGDELVPERFRPVSTFSDAEALAPPLTTQGEQEDGKSLAPTEPSDRERSSPARFLDAILKFLVGDDKFLKMQRQNMSRQRMENVAIMALSHNRPVYLVSDWSRNNNDLECEDMKWALECENVKELVLAPKPEVVSQLERHVIDGDVILVKQSPRELDQLLLPLIQHNFVTINLREITILPVGKRKVICGSSFATFFKCVPTLHGEFEKATADGIPLFSPQVASMTTLVSYRLDADVIREDLVVKSLTQLRPSIGLSLDSLYEAKAAFAECDEKVSNAYEELMARNDISVFSTPVRSQDGSVDLSFSHLLSARYEINRNMRKLDRILFQLRTIANDDLGPICEKSALFLQMAFRMQSGINNTYQKAFRWLGLDYSWFQLGDVPAVEEKPVKHVENQAINDNSDEKSVHSNANGEAKTGEPEEDGQNPQAGENTTAVESQPESAPDTKEDQEKPAGLEENETVIAADVGDQQVLMIAEDNSAKNETKEVKKVPPLHHSISNPTPHKPEVLQLEIPVRPEVDRAIFEAFNDSELETLEKAVVVKPIELVSEELQPSERALLLTAFVLGEMRESSQFLKHDNSPQNDHSKRPMFITKTDWNRLQTFFNANFLKYFIQESDLWKTWVNSDDDDLDVDIQPGGQKLNELEKAYVFGILKPYSFVKFCRKIMEEQLPAIQYDLNNTPRTVVICPSRVSSTIRTQIEAFVEKDKLVVVDKMGRNYIDDLQDKLSQGPSLLVYVPNAQTVPRPVLELVLERHASVGFRIILSIDTSENHGIDCLHTYCIEANEQWYVIAYDLFIRAVEKVHPTVDVNDTTVASKIQANLRRFSPEVQQTPEIFRLAFFLTVVQTISASFLEPLYSFEVSSIPNVVEDFMASFDGFSKSPVDLEQYGRLMLKSTNFATLFEPRLINWIVGKSNETISKFAEARNPEEIASKISDQDFGEFDEYLKDQRTISGRKYFLRFIKLLDLDDSYWYDDPPVVDFTRLWQGLVIAHECIHQMKNKKAKIAYQMAQDNEAPMDPWKAYMKAEAVKLTGLLERIANDLATLAKSIRLDRFAIPKELNSTAIALCQQLAPDTWFNDNDMDFLFRQSGLPLQWYLAQVLEKRFEMFQSVSKKYLTTKASGFLPNLASMLSYFKTNLAMTLAVPIHEINDKITWQAKIVRGETNLAKQGSISRDADSRNQSGNSTPSGLCISNFNFSVMISDSMGTSNTRKFVSVGPIVLEPIPKIPPENISDDDTMMSSVNIPIFSTTNAALSPVDFITRADVNLERAIIAAAGLDPNMTLSGVCHTEAAYFAVLFESAFAEFDVSTGFQLRSRDSTTTSKPFTKAQQRNGIESPGIVSPLAFVEQDTGILSIINGMLFSILL